MNIKQNIPHRIPRTGNEYYNDHTRIYTDGSKKEEKVGYAVVTDQQSTQRRIRDKSLIFSVEQEAVIGAIQKLPTTGVRGVIFTDSWQDGSMKRKCNTVLGDRTCWNNRKR
jgi:hypothetical protein